MSSQTSPDTTTDHPELHRQAIPPSDRVKPTTIHHWRIWQSKLDLAQQEAVLLFLGILGTNNRWAGMSRPTILEEAKKRRRDPNFVQRGLDQLSSDGFLTLTDVSPDPQAISLVYFATPKLVSLLAD